MNNSHKVLKMSRESKNPQSMEIRQQQMHDTSELIQVP